jgi:2-oxo-3-hexenedioate decarboxylase
MTAPLAIADALLAAERERTALTPFTRHNPFLDVEVAYAAQSLVVEQRLHRGETIVGAKLGFTSAVRRQAQGIDSPIYGRLTSAMVVPSGEQIPLDVLIHPRAEPELALVVGRPIAPTATVSEAFRAIDAVLPAIEVVDSRYSEAFRLADSVADNAGAARVVLGARSRPPVELVDLRLLGCLFRCRNRIDTAAGGAAMGDPVVALLWLARALAGRGERLEEGSVVLTGGLTTAVPLRPRTVVTAEFDGLGSVRTHCP